MLLQEARVEILHHYTMSGFSVTQGETMLDQLGNGRKHYEGSPVFVRFQVRWAHCEICHAVIPTASVGTPKRFCDNCLLNKRAKYRRELRAEHRFGR